MNKFLDCNGDVIYVRNYIYHPDHPNYMFVVVGLDFNTGFAIMKHVKWPARQYDTLEASAQDLSKMMLKPRYNQ